MNTQHVAIVSIHPDPANPLALDIKDILGALADHLPQWIWCVRNLDWLGESAQTLCRTVEASALKGHWLASEDLLSQARSVYQTIVAVDGGFFDVYAKDPEMLASLRELGDVRDENTKMYF